MRASAGHGLHEWELLIQPDCELCEELHALIVDDGRIAVDNLALVPLSERPELYSQYAFSIPVLLHRGNPVIMGRVAAETLAVELDKHLARATSTAI